MVKVNAETFLMGRLGMAVTVECPQCGDAGPHDTNGDVEPTMLCENCGFQHDLDYSEGAVPRMGPRKAQALA